MKKELFNKSKISFFKISLILLVFFSSAFNFERYDSGAKAKIQFGVQTAPLPDLIVDQIECSPSNKLLVVIKNIGTGSLPSGWSAVADVYFNGVKEGFFSLKTPTSKTDGGIEEGGGSSTYLLAWDINKAVTVRVNADSTNSITESNEQNNIKEATIEPVVTLLPDLIVSEVKCDRKNDRISYVVKNVGEGKIVGGCYIRLFVDDEEETIEAISLELQQNEIFESWFADYQWPECNTISVKVCVDFYDQIDESDEQNNCLETVCECEREIIFPRILSIPTVSQITESSAQISWETNIECNSIVKYSKYSGQYELVEEDTSLVSIHNIVLKNLEPSTTYNFIVESTDINGNLVRSQNLNLATLASFDNDKPSVSLLLPSELLGTVTLIAEAQDNSAVDRVVFLCDGRRMFTDFSPPYEWQFDTLSLTEGSHLFGAVAYDAAGNYVECSEEGPVFYPILDAEGPLIAFTNPLDGDEVSGDVYVDTIVQDLTGYVDKVEMYIDGVLKRRWIYTSFEYDLFTGTLTPVSPVSELEFDYLWNTTGIEFGTEHTIEVRAWDDAENTNTFTIQVTKKRPEWAPPSYTVEPVEIIRVELSREVVIGRNGNWLDVYLYIRNTGTEIVDNIQIREKCRGFQAISLSPDTSVRYSYSSKTSEVAIEAVMGTFHPGDLWTFHYHVVPVLFPPIDPISDDEYVLGFDDTEVLFTRDGRLISCDFEIPEHINYMDYLFGNADYLIVTDPQTLFIENDFDPDVELLLQEAAWLAREKRGVLGYLKSYDNPFHGALNFKLLIQPGGAWASRLNPAFTHPDTMDAYLLIIGEDEIVPSYTYDIRDLNIEWSSGGQTEEVKLSDNYYADTVSNNGVPDLIVGRIIGNDVSNLRKPIQVSLGVYAGFEGYGFNFFNALLVSGTGSGQSVFVGNVDEIRDILAPVVTAVKIHWKDYWLINTFERDFEQHDGLAAGDVLGDDKCEIIVADRDDHVYILGLSGTVLGGFDCDFDEGYALAVGDVLDDYKCEILIGRTDGYVYIYDKDGFVDSFNCYFESFDSLAVGDVISGGKSEIVKGDTSDYIIIYNVDGDIEEAWDWDFESFDKVAVGDVMDDSKEEIVMADRSDHIYIFDNQGNIIGGFTCDFERGESLVVADVCGDAKEEIIIGDNNDFISVYDHLGNELRRIVCDIQTYDGLASGNILWDDKEEIFIGDRDDYIHMTDVNYHNRMADVFKILARDRGIIYFRDHGNLDVWDPGLYTWDFPVTFNNNPVVFGCACLTGDYEGGDDYNIAEAFLGSGAAVYIGSTEVSSRSHNSDAGEWFFDHWDYSESVGKALMELERNKCSRSDWWEFWVYEYNYYGDPKFPWG